MTEIEAYEYVIQLYPKCGLKTVAVFGMDITPYLKHGFRDVQFEPKHGLFDCVIELDAFDADLWFRVPIGGIYIVDRAIYSPYYIQIHSGKLNAYKRKA